MNQENKEIFDIQLTKITLKCGRDFQTEAGYSGDGCGSCETNTNNHTQATCCL